MIRFLSETKDDVVGVELSESVGATDFRAMTELLAETASQHGPIRLLVKVDRLEDVAPLALWEEFKFAIEHVKELERIALVSDSALHEAYVKIVDPILPGKMRHFEVEEIEPAWRWIRGTHW